MQEYLTKLNALGAEYSLRLLGGLAILIIGIWIARKLAHLCASLLEKAQIDGTLSVFATNMVRIVLFGLVILAALNSVGVPMTSVVALLGTIGLAVALALKDSLNNVAAGLSLLILRPFRVGDYIEIGSTGGTVIELNFFHTIFNTADNRRVIVPNSKAISEVITNFSRNEVRRVDMVYIISYSSDLKQAEAIFKALIDADERLLKEPAPVVAVLDLAPNGVEFAVRPWAKWDIYWDVKFDFNQKVKLAFDEAGIQIPFPQRDVHLISPPDGLKVRWTSENGPVTESGQELPPRPDNSRKTESAENA